MARVEIKRRVVGGSVPAAGKRVDVHHLRRPRVLLVVGWRGGRLLHAAAATLFATIYPAVATARAAHVAAASLLLRGVRRRTLVGLGWLL